MIADSLLSHQIADEVWYVPARDHCFDKQMSAATHRISMLSKVLKYRTRLEMVEIERPGKSDAYTTMIELSSQYPHYEFNFVIGSDNLPDFHLWDNYQELLSKFRFLVYPRFQSPMEPLRANMQPLSSFKEVSVSSTMVRQYCYQQQPLNGLVDPKVAKYIQEHQLYQI